jgi:hypothetical protein
MANSNFYQKSSKGVQPGVIDTARSNVQRVKGASEPKNPAYGSKASQTNTATELKHEIIAERAWNIWQNRGCIPGEDERNWYEAENQLRAEFDID